MEIFADTADLKEIRTWLDFGVIDGVTTNPTILLASGVYQLREGIVEIAKLLGDKPLSAEVVTDEPDEMYTQGVAMAAWATNIVVKIPVITTQGKPCFGVIAALSKAGIKVNATACLSFNQTMLAAKAGATYVSIFGDALQTKGRIQHRSSETPRNGCRCGSCRARSLLAAFGRQSTFKTRRSPAPTW